MFFSKLEDNGVLKIVHPLYVRIVPRAELEAVPKVLELFAEPIPDVIYELMAGNHRAFVHAAYWYVFFLLFTLTLF